VPGYLLKVEASSLLNWGLLYVLGMF
jgi:hypothetical protein